MLGSSMLANTACAGFMPSAWFTSSTPSRTKTAPPRPPCARRSGSSTAISRPIVARPPCSARPPLWQSSIAYSPAKPASSPSTAYSRGCMPTRRSCSRCSIGPRFRCTPTARETPSAAMSPDAKSQAAPAAISAETVATPSSPWPRPAPSSTSLFGITSGHGSPPQAQPSSRPFPSWSSREPNRPDRHDFCPTYEEIKLSCSCPDWADMCKHVAAALYGVGARLDESPQLLFVLRGVDENELLANASKDLALTRAVPDAAKILDDS